MPKARFYAKFALNSLKYVKIRFTLSALSAMEFIFVMLSEPPCPFGNNKRTSFLVLIVKVLKMKTYTLTWRHSPFYGSTLSRCRFDSLCPYWNRRLPNDKIQQFCFQNIFRGDCSLRLIKNGRLVARSAAYQGF